MKIEAVEKGKTVIQELVSKARETLKTEFIHLMHQYEHI